MIDEARATIIRSIDNRVRELDLLDLVQIGYYNVNLKVFGYNAYGRIAIISDNDPLMEVELFDVEGKSLGTINTSRKYVIRSIIDYEFSPEDLKVYDGYLSYKMLQSLKGFDGSVSSIANAYRAKKSLKRDIFDIDRRINELMPVIDFDYCLIGSQTLYDAIERIKESIKKEYIKEGVEAASYNDSIERLERSIIGRHIHKRKIADLKKAIEDNTQTRLTTAATRSDELLDSIEKYMSDFKKRCMTVLKNFKVLNVARLSYVARTKDASQEVTAEMIYKHFAETIPFDEVISADELFERFKNYILGYLFDKRDSLEKSLVRMDEKIRDEFSKQEAIVSDFVPFNGISRDDEDTYSRVYNERRK